MTKKEKKTNVNNETLPVRVDIGDFILDVAESSERVLEGEVCDFDSKTVSWIKKKSQFAFDSLFKKFPNAVNIIASFPQKAKEIFALDEKHLKEMLDKGLELKTFKSDPSSFDPIFRGNGKFAAHARLKKLSLPSGNPAEFTQALAMAAMAKQLENISVAVESVKESVSTVLQGQWDDRLAIADGAKRILITALNCDDPQIRQQLLSTAIAQNSMGLSQIYRSLQSEIGMCRDFKKKKDAECQKILDQTFLHTQGFFDAVRTQCVLLNEAHEYKALAATTAQLNLEIESIFTKDNLLMLNSQTNKKNDVNFWSQTVNNCITSIKSKLDNIGKNATFQLEFQKKKEIDNG